MTAAIALFLFGVLTAVLSLQLPLGNLHAPGSGFFPFALGLALMALSAGQAIQLHMARPKAAPPAGEDRGALRRVTLFMGAVVLATALLKPLGYAPVSFLLMLALLQTLGMRKWHAGLIALLSAAASHIVFVMWLKIPLPAAGWLGF